MLSKRLLKIADLIDSNKVVYDVGSDHALLPCFLVLNNKSNKVYAVDNKEGPLKKAKLNIEKYNLQGKVIPVLSNGIDGIKSDVDIITITGMGFYTVKSILENKDLSKYEKIIVQVNKDTDKLRLWISTNNYTIIDEEIVVDDFFYEIVVFIAKPSRKLTDLEIKYGPINLIRKDNEFISYITYKLNKLKEINMALNKPEYTKLIEEMSDIIL